MKQNLNDVVFLFNYDSRKTWYHLCQYLYQWVHGCSFNANWEKSFIYIMTRTRYRQWDDDVHSYTRSTGLNGFS